jgi:hypothetical protein
MDSATLSSDAAAAWPALGAPAAGVDRSIFKWEKMAARLALVSSCARSLPAQPDDRGVTTLKTLKKGARGRLGSEQASGVQARHAARVS